MRFFLDTEFVDDGSDGIQLISIAVVSENGGEFYLCNRDLMLFSVPDWHWENVMPHLPPFGDQNDTRRWVPYEQIGPALLDFVNSCLRMADQHEIEFWAWYADYDFVVMSSLYGPLINRPNGWPMYCRDLKQYADSLGNPRIPRMEGIGSKHDALYDARENLHRYNWLREYENQNEVYRVEGV